MSEPASIESHTVNESTEVKDDEDDDEEKGLHILFYITFLYGFKEYHMHTMSIPLCSWYNGKLTVIDMRMKFYVLLIFSTPCLLFMF